MTFFIVRWFKKRMSVSSQLMLSWKFSNTYFFLNLHLFRITKTLSPCNLIFNNQCFATETHGTIAQNNLGRPHSPLPCHLASKIFAVLFSVFLHHPLFVSRSPELHPYSAGTHTHTLGRRAFVVEIRPHISGVLSQPWSLINCQH